MLGFLDTVFTLFHTAIILFALSGWAWKTTRGLHLLVMSLTMGSWFLLGINYGFGYCPSTEWHWNIKRSLGETELPYSFVEYLLELLTGSDFATGLLDVVVAVAGIVVFAISFALNLRDRRRRQEHNPDRR